MKVHIPAEDMPSPERQAAIQERIESIREYGRRLTDWEHTFLNSIEEQVLRTQGVLTTRQREVLNQLYAEYVDDEEQPL